MRTGEPDLIEFSRKWKSCLARSTASAGAIELDPALAGRGFDSELFFEAWRLRVSLLKSCWASRAFSKVQRLGNHRLSVQWICRRRGAGSARVKDRAQLAANSPELEAGPDVFAIIGIKFVSPAQRGTNGSGGAR